MFFLTQDSSRESRLKPANQGVFLKGCHQRALVPFTGLLAQAKEWIHRCQAHSPPCFSLGTDPVYSHTPTSLRQLGYPWGALAENQSKTRE